MTTPSSLNPTRIITKHSTTANEVPSTSLAPDSKGNYTGLYLGELAVNSYQSGTVITSAGLFFRVGSATTEQSTDQLMRIGPAYVTSDATTATSPTVVGLPNATLQMAGQLWLRTSDNAFFINTGSVWQQVTPGAATTATQGLIQLAASSDVIAGTSSTLAVSPSSLDAWSQARALISEKTPSYSFYVDGYAGNDSVQNDGRSFYTPFKTIERALLEVAKWSYLPAAGNTPSDYFANSTVFVGIGDYVVDNRPGATAATQITPLTTSSTGPIQPLLVGTITSYDLTSSTLILANPVTAELGINQQLFSSGGGVAVIDAILETGFTLRLVTGSWLAGESVYVPQHRAFNTANGSIIVPRGCSIVGADLRKTRIRPAYVGDLADWETESDCFNVGRTSIFKLTGGSYLTSLTFTDNLDILSSHHLCTCVEFAATTDLADSSSGYYAKVFTGFSATLSPAMISGDLVPVEQESTIVADTTSASADDSTGFPAVDEVNGASPYVFNCSVLSRFGLCGMLVDGSKVTGFKSMVTAQFTNITMQVDPRAFVADATYPGGFRYNDLWRHFAFQACNGGYIQIVSCFVIGAATHYQTLSGGELSITNSCSDFGDESLVSTGFSSTILPQDTGGTITKLIPPKPITSTTQSIPTFLFVAANSTTAKLYVEGTITNDAIAPYSFQAGDTLYIDNGEGTTYTANLSVSAPLYANDSNGWYFITETAANSIFTNASSLNLFPITIQRTPDTRSNADRIFWLQVDGITSSSQRPPQQNFVLQFGSQMSTTLNQTLFVAAVSSTDSTGANLPVGSYQIALLSATGLNDPLSALYPPLNVDEPQANSPSSLTYKSIQTLLTALGLSSTTISSLLTTSLTPVTLPTTIYPTFARPSLIRCSMHTWEWLGYMNYSSALPKFQTTVLSFADFVLRQKVESNGGRVYCTGMDQDGNFYLGSQVVSLATGQTTTIGSTDQSTIFQKLTVTERLLMDPGSTLVLNSANISIDARTAFTTPITPASSTYATTTQAGFVELATTAQVAAGVNTTNAVVPADLSTAVNGALDALIPLGTFHECQFNTPPSYGTWLHADGSEIRVDTYAAYYAAAGSPALSSPASLSAPLGKFRLPNRVGTVAIGAGTAASGTVYTSGETGGQETHTLTVNEIPNITPTGSLNINLIDNGHAHSYTDLWHYDNTQNPPSNVGSIAGEDQPQFVGSGVGAVIVESTKNTAVAGTGITASGSLQADSFGGGAAHNNMQPFYVSFIFVRVA